MTQPFAFEQLHLIIPELWDKPWDELVADEDEGLQQELLAAQARYARMLARLDPKPVTPQKVAWLAFWARMFGALTGVRGASIWESRFSVEVLGRVSYETSLQLHAVMLPALTAGETGDGHLREEHWTEVRDRLCAYLAWSLHGDEELYRHVSTRRHLIEAFDRRPEREFIRDLGEGLQGWEQLSGQRLELVSDQEASHDRDRAARFFHQELNRVERWMSDERLEPWLGRLRQLKAPPTRGAVSLFRLLNVGDSVNAFLRSRGLGIAYFEYLKGSAFIHGSSLDAAMFTTDAAIAPDFASMTGDFESRGMRLVREFHMTALLLDLLLSHLGSRSLSPNDR